MVVKLTSEKGRLCKPIEMKSIADPRCSTRAIQSYSIQMFYNWTFRNEVESDPRWGVFLAG